MSYKIKSNCLKFSSVAVFLLFLQMGFGQTNKKNTRDLGTGNFKDLDDVVLKNQKLLGNNVVIMIWTDTLVYKRELGDFDAKTIAPIASCSKWLTTSMVMKFAEEGKISLDDKVGKYIPIFDTYGKSYITIRHCLSHFTGIQSEPLTLMKILQRKKYGSLEEEVNDFAKKEIQSNPGTEFRYSNIGLNIAARILEIVSKKKFDMLIKQQLFNPLGMRQTTFSTLDGSAVNPSGGALSSANDYMHFLQMLLNKGKYNGQQILSEATVKEMRKIQTQPEQIKYTPAIVQGYNYAMGSWVLEEGKNSEASVLSCPGLFGTWPMVDWCRGYACLVFVKTLLGEQKKEVYIEMEEAIDGRLHGTCSPD